MSKKLIADNKTHYDNTTWWSFLIYCIPFLLYSYFFSYQLFTMKVLFRRKTKVTLKVEGKLHTLSQYSKCCELLTGGNLLSMSHTQKRSIDCGARSYSNIVVLIAAQFTNMNNWCFLAYLCVTLNKLWCFLWHLCLTEKVRES